MPRSYFTIREIVMLPTDAEAAAIKDIMRQFVYVAEEASITHGAEETLRGLACATAVVINSTDIGVAATMIKFLHSLTVALRGLQ